MELLLRVSVRLCIAKFLLFFAPLLWSRPHVFSAIYLPRTQGFQGPWHPVQPDWSAFREQMWGYGTLQFRNATLAQFQFITHNTSKVLYSFDLERSSPPSALWDTAR